MLACQNFFMKKISSSFFKQKGDNEMNNSLDLSNSLKCVFVCKKRNSISKLCALFQRPPNVLHSKEAIAEAAQKERPLETPAPPLPCDLPPQQRRTAFSRTQGSEEIARPQPCLMMTFDNDTHTHTAIQPNEEAIIHKSQLAPHQICTYTQYLVGSMRYQTILFLSPFFLMYYPNNPSIVFFNLSSSQD